MWTNHMRTETFRWMEYPLQQQKISFKDPLTRNTHKISDLEHD